jgi:hypothetical protein
MESEQLLQPLESLQEELAVSDLNETLELWAQQAEADRTVGKRREPLLIHRTGHIKLFIYQEPTEHRRPHFHIAFKKEYNASYAIDDFSRIVGEMPKRYEAIMLSWAKKHQAMLQHRWEQIQAGNSVSLEVESDVTILEPPADGDPRITREIIWPYQKRA